MDGEDERKRLTRNCNVSRYMAGKSERAKERKSLLWVGAQVSTIKIDEE